MKQKKSKTLFYLLALLVIAGIIFVATREIPMIQEHVEQALPVSLTTEKP